MIWRRPGHESSEGTRRAVSTARTERLSGGQAATEGSPGTLLAPLEAGAYEIWYVIGSDATVQARRPITVTAAVATLDGPDDIAHGAEFEVTWTGPNGPGDYVTIVAAGAERWTDEPYFYTHDGNPGTLTAPDESGDHQLWYVTGQGSVVIESVPIQVK